MSVSLRAPGLWESEHLEGSARPLQSRHPGRIKVGGGAQPPPGGPSATCCPAPQGVAGGAPWASAPAQPV